MIEADATAPSDGINFYDWFYLDLTRLIRGKLEIISRVIITFSGDQMLLHQKDELDLVVFDHISRMARQ